MTVRFLVLAALAVAGAAAHVVEATGTTRSPAGSPTRSEVAKSLVAVIDHIDHERLTPTSRSTPIPGPSARPSPEPVLPRWDQGGVGDWKPVSEGTPIEAADVIESGDKLAVRIAIPALHSAITLAEGTGMLKRLPSEQSDQSQEPCFRLESGVAFASLDPPHVPLGKKKKPAIPPVFAILETGKLSIGTRQSARILILAPDAHGKGDPAAIYAISGEIEVATSREALMKGLGLRVPSGHGVLEIGPNGVESPRPFQSAYELLRRYSSLERLRGMAIKSGTP